MTVVLALVCFSILSGHIHQCLGQTTPNEDAEESKDQKSGLLFLSRVLLAVGLIVLTLTTVAVTLVIIFRKWIFRVLRELLGYPPSHEDIKGVIVADNEPQLSSCQHHVNIIPPPPPPIKGQPEEFRLNPLTPTNSASPSVSDDIGFCVTAEVHDENHEEEREEEEGRDGHASKKWSLLPPSATDPFLLDAKQKEMADEAAGYLVGGATYQYDQEKRDLSPMSTMEREGCALYAGMETALRYDQREEIKGEVIEEVDYQNVTVVRTHLLEESTIIYAGEKEESRNHAHETDDNEDDMDYISVESFEMPGGGGGGAEVGGGYSTRAPRHQPTFRTDPPTALPLVSDAVSVKSSQSYENFDPRQMRVKAGDKLGPGADRLDSARTAGGGDKVHSSSQQNPITEEIYVNAPVQRKKAAPCNRQAYENMVPGMYTSKHFSDH